jgi:uncharacterized protein (DUF302 family)
LKEKIATDFRPYVIVGACNPRMAHQALQAEDKIGTMLRCNVILQQAGGIPKWRPFTKSLPYRRLKTKKLQRWLKVQGDLKSVIGSL